MNEDVRYNRLIVFIFLLCGKDIPYALLNNCTDYIQSPNACNQSVYNKTSIDHNNTVTLSPVHCFSFDISLMNKLPIN